MGKAGLALSPVSLSGGGHCAGEEGQLVPEQILVSAITDTTFPVTATGAPHSTQTPTGTHAPAPQGAFWPPFYDKQENWTQRVSVTGLKTHSKMQGPDSEEQTQSPVFPHPCISWVLMAGCDPLSSYSGGRFGSNNPKLQ